MSKKSKLRGDLLIEIGCEEIPAGMIALASAEFKALLEKYLPAHRLIDPIADASRIEIFFAPRRIAAACSSILLRQPDEEREIVGPPKSIAYDSVGAPTRAATSFAEKQGVAIDKLYLVATPRGECLAAKKITRGRAAHDILAEVLPQAISQIPWPRTMYWTGMAGLHFIRPVRWIVALLDGKVVRFDLAGIAAGNSTAGHRFLGKSKIALRGPKDYVPRLRQNFVLARPEDRRRKIEVELDRLAKRAGAKLHHDPALLDAVVYLNEYPTVIAGSFDPSFLDLPREILTTVMRDHQKYFALDRRDGSLAPGFLAVINLDRDRAGLIGAGHERVLRARFSDARFFWEADQKCRLADNLPKLAQVTFQEKLGSYAQKIERVRALARWIADQWFAQGIHEASVAGVDRAAELAKCDLVTQMVGEFPELQGVVGGLYAKAQGEPQEISEAVRDHYRPVGLDDDIPRNLTGCTVSLADKLDTLVGCFAVGLAPTGSSDPFALRRAATGIVKIVVERKLPLSLSGAVAQAAKILSSSPPHVPSTPEIERHVLDFLLDRARFAFEGRWGGAYDEIKAALAAGSDDLVDAQRRMEAVQAIRGTKNFEPLAVSFKRIRKILEKAGPASAWKLSSVRKDLFTEPAEKELFAAAARVAVEADKEKRGRRYREALERIATLRPAVDRFFESVMVMAEDAEVRKNRLTLLAELLAQFSTIADFSEIVPKQAS
ncbi:MAG: glycine--tRNA ligase subunit beta [Candidatus Acidiferrales bacterium]